MADAKRRATIPMHSVVFGAVARTLAYRYGDLELTFTFDAVPRLPGSDSPATLVLEHWGPSSPRPAAYDLAFDRAKAFLESCGYQVQVHGQ